MANFRDFVHQDYLKESGVLEEGPIGATIGHKLALAGTKILSKVPVVGSHFQGLNDTRDTMDAIMNEWVRYRAQQGVEADLPSINAFATTNGFDGVSLSTGMAPERIQKAQETGADQQPIAKAPDQPAIDQLVHALSVPATPAEVQGGQGSHEAAAAHLIELSQKNANKARIGQWMTYLTFHNPEIMNNPAMSPLAKLRRGKIFSRSELYTIFQGLARAFLLKHGPVANSTNAPADGVQNANTSSKTTPFDKNDPFVAYQADKHNIPVKATITLLTIANKARSVDQVYQTVEAANKDLKSYVLMINNLFTSKGGTTGNTETGTLLKTFLAHTKFTYLDRAQLLACWQKSEGPINNKGPLNSYISDTANKLRTPEEQATFIKDVKECLAVALMAYAKSPANDATPAAATQAPAEQQPA